MTRFRIGCTGWSYTDWRGPFYPPMTAPNEYLERYARVFDLVEIDSTYYRAPSADAARRWADATPEGFLFTAKLPGEITHDGRLRDVGRLVDGFLGGLEPLRQAGKLGPLVAQLPATFRAPQDEAALHDFLDAWPSGFALAVELRHASWWNEATYARLRKAGAALVWSLNENGTTPPVVTTPWLYARVIGDRQLTQFDRIQREGTPELARLAEQFRTHGADAEGAYVLLNNHFMGYAPGTVAIMAELLGLPRPDLARAARAGGQVALSDFSGPG